MEMPIMPFLMRVAFGFRGWFNDFHVDRQRTTERFEIKKMRN